LLGRGTQITLKEMMEQIKLRDYTDRHKKIGALKRVRGAVVIDNTKLSKEETVDAIMLQMIR
jgi:cytidylate kinase